MKLKSSEVSILSGYYRTLLRGSGILQIIIGRMCDEPKSNALIELFCFILSAARQRGCHGGPVEPYAGRRRSSIHVSAGRVVVNSSGSTPSLELINN